MTFSKEGLLQASEDAPWVDVAVVGGGLTGLSCALALLRVDPTLKVQVFERRPEPSDAYGGAVRLEANGLEAAEALSRQLAADIRANGVSAAQMMFHDMEAGTVITRLSPSAASLFTTTNTSSSSSGAPTPGKPTARQHAPLVIGWAELEAILEQQLPEGTVQWGTNLLGYTDVGSHVVLQVAPSQASLGHPTGDVAGDKGPRSNTGWLPVVDSTDGTTAAGGGGEDTAGTSGEGAAGAAASSSQYEEGEDVAAHQIEPTYSDMELTKDQTTELAASFFKGGAATGAASDAAADGDQEEGAGTAAEGEGEGGVGSSSRPTATTPDDPVDPQPAESDQPVTPVSPGDAPVTPTSSSNPRLRPIQTSAASPRPAGPSSSRPATPLHPYDQQQQEEAAAAGSRGGSALPVQLVRAGLVLAADGAFSSARQEVVLEEPAPTFDGTLRWVGRLPGNLMATTPVEYEAWWLAPGKAFTSHPLRNGDVAWEALVSTDMLAALGWQYNPGTGLLERTVQHNNTNTPDQPQEGSAAGAAGGDGGGSSWGGFGASAPVTPVGSTAGTPRRGGVTAAAPAGVMEAGASPGTPFSSAGAKAGGFGSSSRGYGASKAESGAQLEGAAAASPAGGANKTDMAEALTALLSSFPAPVRNMVAHTPPEVLLAAAVYIRPARAMPAALGKGRLALVGEAARPLRPSGQEASQALEDGAALGAALMSHGASVEMLRRFELGRRRRWVHVTQVSMALAACSNLGGLGLHQGVVDYYTDLYNVSFTPLRRIKKPRRGPGVFMRLVRGLGGALLAYGGVAAAAGGLKAARGRVDSGKVDKRVVRAVEAAGDVLDVVLQAPGQGLQVAGKVMQQGGKVAAAAERKVTGAVVGAMGNMAGSTTTEHPVVYGDVPGGSGEEGAGTKVKRWAVDKAMGAATVASKPVVGVVSDTLGHKVAKALGAF